MKSSSDIEAWLTSYLAKELKVEPSAIGREQPFADFGLGSRQAILLAGELEDWLGVELDAAVLWEHPTVATLAAHLAK